MADTVMPPQAKKVPITLLKHKDKRVDEYLWLNNRNTDEVLTHLNRENEYLESQMKPTTKLQEQMFGEMKARLKEDDRSVPFRRGEYWYYHRFESGSEYPIYARKKGGVNGPEQILLNVNELAKGHKYYDVAGLTASFDQNQMAFGVDTVGRRFYDIHFKDLKTGKVSSFTIPQVSPQVVWANDNKTVFFVKKDEQTLRAYQIYRVEIGGKAELVYEEKDEKFSVGISKSLTRKFIFIGSESSTTSEVRYFSADRPKDEPKIFSRREKGHEYGVEDGGDRFFVLTNSRAKNFRVMECKHDKTEKRSWKEAVPHRKDVLVEDVLVLKDHIVLEERAKGLTALSYFKRGTKKRSTITFPDPAYLATLGPNAEYETTAFRYEYESLVRPETTYDFDLENKKSLLIEQKTIPTYDPALYESKRVFATAKDKTKIPVSLVYKKDLYKKGKNPLFVYGYGSYGISSDPHFHRNIVSLVDRGFVFAIAHIRGGSEMGRPWYDNGKLLRKKNTFTDFVAATEALLKTGYGERGHVYAMGGSAGGLLMGAVMNLRPDLYRGIVASVPFVDVVTTMLDDTIPLTTNEYEEWGNPNEAKYYKYIKSYSPYDNIEKTAYPDVLVITGYHDSQVQYWEPTKWVLRLRDNNTADTKILFKIDMAAGHSGTTGRYKALKDDALEYAFIVALEANTRRTGENHGR